MRREGASSRTRPRRMPSRRQGGNFPKSIPNSEGEASTPLKLTSSDTRMQRLASPCHHDAFLEALLEA